MSESIRSIDESIIQIATSLAACRSEVVHLLEDTEIPSNAIGFFAVDSLEDLFDEIEWELCLETKPSFFEADGSLRAFS